MDEEVLEYVDFFNPFCYDIHGNAPCSWEVIQQKPSFEGWVLVGLKCVYEGCTQPDCEYVPLLRPEILTERRKRLKDANSRFNPPRDN